MENNSLTDIVKSRRESGEGGFSSFGGEVKERLKEKLDWKRVLPQSGLLTALFPKLKAYKAQKAASPTEKVLKNIDADFKLFAKNSKKLKSIATNFSLMKREVNKLAKLQKVVPATETKSNLPVRDLATTSPTKLEPKKGNNMFLLIAAVAAVGVAMALGYKKLEESFDVSINGALKSVSNLGGDLYDKLKSSFENMNFKQLIADNKSVMEKEVKDSFARNKNSMLDRQLVKQIEDELNRDVVSDEDVALGAAMKANVEAQNPMNYAQDGPGTNRTTIQTVVPPTSRAPSRVPGENIISSRYGSRVMNGKTQMHEGLDIKGKTGEPIFSTGKGKAIIGRENSGFGIWVIVDHGNGLQTWYGHMSQHAIENGQDVDAGTIIGYVGSTGISTGPHLHYQIMKDGKSIDPVNSNPSELKNYTFTKYGLLDITPDAARDTRESTPPSVQKLTTPQVIKESAISDEDSIQLAQKIGISKEQWVIFRESIASIESGGKYDIAGGAGNHYDGRYQLGKAAKTDAARIAGIPDPKHDEASRESFRKNPKLQELLFAGMTVANDGYLKNLSSVYRNADINKKLEILAYAHNQGAGGAAKWLQSGITGKDAFGTAGTKYSELLATNLKTIPIKVSTATSAIEQTLAQSAIAAAQQTNMNAQRNGPQQSSVATNSTPDLYVYLLDKLVSNYG
jgi:murein DD-endopeptidase MepM/ murein hydrolase activator NlpD